MLKVGQFDCTLTFGGRLVTEANWSELGHA